MSYKYAIKNVDKGAKALGVSLPISLKQSVEIATAIRGKQLEKAKTILTQAIKGVKAISFKRFNSDTGHKTGIGPGRYPKKASENILQLLENAEANAQFKGLNTGNLSITHIMAQNASRSMHFGRKRSRKTKRTHIEVVLEEKND